MTPKISLNTAYALSRIAGVTATLLLGMFVYTLFNRAFGDCFLFGSNILYNISVTGFAEYNEILIFPYFENLLSVPVPFVFFISLMLSMRGSLGGRFVWLGSLVCFITISFLNTVLFFKTTFPFISELTFLSIITLVLSIFAFIGGFLSLEPKKVVSNMELTYGMILKRRGRIILYFLFKTLCIPYMCFSFVFLLFDRDLRGFYMAKFVFIVIICGILSLYSVYIVNIWLLRKNHPLSYVLTPILLAMDFVPCNFPYSFTSLFAIALFILFMKDIKGKQEETVHNVKS
jgi:hypothetical protein